MLTRIRDKLVYFEVDSPKPPDFKWIVLAHGTEPAPKLEGDVFMKSMVQTFFSDTGTNAET